MVTPSSRQHYAWCLAALIGFWGSLAGAVDTTNIWGYYPTPLIPDNNPLNRHKIALGKRLFSETKLSSTGTYSCASCHQPDKHFTDGRPLAIGATGESHSRHTPTLYNSAYNSSLGWDDAGIATLEQQHLIPLFNEDPVEMGYQPALLRRLADESDYVESFSQAFDGEMEAHATLINTENVVRALASYVRSITAPASAFNLYLFEDRTDALSEDAKAGMDLFFSERLGCSACHASLSFSGPVSHTRQSADPVFHVTGVGGSHQAFRAPTLRQISNTAPYMHDGSLKNLPAVIDHYERTDVERVPKFALNKRERRQLIAFLDSL